MMIQSGPTGEPRFISLMAEHNELCEQFARAFGNARFEVPDPYEETIYVIGHHDRGWDEFDASPALDPITGFPAGVGGAKGAGGAATTKLSPDYNQAHHDYCGLLASMHTWGLYHARYGFSNFRVRQGGSTSVPISPEMAEETNAILFAEVERQNALKEKISANLETKNWVEEKNLYRNYKLLQFCDTLALYFNLRHEDERAVEVFTHVPENTTSETSVTIRPEGNNCYSLTPFPFKKNRLKIHSKGRYFTAMSLNSAAMDLGAYIAELPIDEQVFTLVAN